MRFFASSQPPQSWITPKAQTGLASKIHGKGLFAVQFIKAGEIVAIKSGHVISKLDLAKLDRNLTPAMQINDDFYIGPTSDKEVKKSLISFNHSCDPNLGVAGNIMLVAIKDINAGEELTADYAMFIADPDYVLECHCDALAHRPQITGNDWQIPALQKKYASYFSWYIEQKLKKPNLQA